ncbi:hypothetical protein SLE2022_387690 [Rubroshorea leprosula]
MAQISFVRAFVAALVMALFVAVSAQISESLAAAPGPLPGARSSLAVSGVVHLPFVRLASRNGTDQLREGFCCGFGDGAFRCRLGSDHRVSCCGSWSSPRCWILSGDFWCRRWGVFDRISSRSVEAVD